MSSLKPKKIDTVKIAEKEIGGVFPCYVISEIGNNHGVNIDTAKEMIKISCKVGADAVKFQTFKAMDIVNPKVPADAYRGWDVSDKFEYWHEFVDTLAMPYEWYGELIDYARDLGIGFISTPASLEAASFLVEKGVDALKIASMDVNNIPFLSEIDRMGLPVILSTGMATMEEIQEAVTTLRTAPLILLHCVSNYPLKYEDANLLNIRMLSDYFELPVGFSNHSLGYDLDMAAIGLGADVIEKHFTLDRSTSSTAEHHFSMEPEEMKGMIEKIRMIEKALGSYKRIFSQEELSNRKQFRRSIVARYAMDAGETIKDEDLAFVRPGTGLPPGDKEKVVGKKLKCSIKAYDFIRLEEIY